jgi:hypothetical protein
VKALKQEYWKRDGAADMIEAITLENPNHSSDDMEISCEHADSESVLLGDSLILSMVTMYRSYMYHLLPMCHAYMKVTTILGIRVFITLAF